MYLNNIYYRRIDILIDCLLYNYNSCICFIIYIVLLFMYLIICFLLYFYDYNHLILSHLSEQSLLLFNKY